MLESFPTDSFIDSPKMLGGRNLCCLLNCLRGFNEPMPRYFYQNTFLSFIACKQEIYCA